MEKYLQDKPPSPQWYRLASLRKCVQYNAAQWVYNLESRSRSPENTWYQNSRAWSNTVIVRLKDVYQALETYPIQTTSSS